MPGCNVHFQKKIKLEQWPLYQPLLFFFIIPAFASQGRVLWAPELKWCIKAGPEGHFGPLSKNSVLRGVNEAVR